MRNTPRKRRFGSALRGYWDRFPVSPQPYDEEDPGALPVQGLLFREHVVRDRPDPGSYVEQAGKLLEAGKAAQAQALLRAWMTVIIELMETGRRLRAAASA